MCYFMKCSKLFKIIDYFCATMQDDCRDVYRSSFQFCFFIEEPKYCE